MGSKIKVTPENLDQLVERYAEEWWDAARLDRTFVKMNENCVRMWARNGEVRSRHEARTSKKPYVFFNVADAIIARSNHRQLGSLGSRTINGVTEYRCTLCEQWKGDDAFKDDKRSVARGSFITKRSRCNQCESDRTKILWREDKKFADARKKRSKRIRKQQIEARDAAVAWKAPRAISASIFVEIVNRRLRGTNESICQQLGLDVRGWDRVRRSAETGAGVLLESVDRWLTNADLQDELHVIHDEIEAQRPRWWKDYASCIKCNGISRPHKAAGLCDLCYRNRKNPDWIPPQGDGLWARSYDQCIVCGRSDSPHSCRGRCTRCHSAHYRKRRKAVGSEHGTVQLKRTEEKSSHRSSGRNNQRRQPV